MMHRLAIETLVLVMIAALSFGHEGEEDESADGTPEAERVADHERDHAQDRVDQQHHDRKSIASRRGRPAPRAETRRPVRPPRPHRRPRPPRGLAGYR